MKQNLSHKMSCRPCGAVEVQLCTPFNLDARWGGWSAPRLGRLTPPSWKRVCTHCVRGWLGPRAGLDGCGKSRLLPPVFDPRIVQPVTVITQTSLLVPSIGKVNAWNFHCLNSEWCNAMRFPGLHCECWNAVPLVLLFFPVCFTFTTLRRKEDNIVIWPSVCPLSEFLFLLSLYILIFGLHFVPIEYFQSEAAFNGYQLQLLDPK